LSPSKGACPRGAPGERWRKQCGPKIFGSEGQKRRYGRPTRKNGVVAREGKGKGTTKTSDNGRKRGKKKESGGCVEMLNRNNRLAQKVNSARIGKVPNPNKEIMDQSTSVSTK